ncbi:hypothetical protein [Pyrobaculum aerophilum]|uniref:hypothetical protein n=1 Tax=Pyrobaculum aerophilum TaxID=13773 RepID=UPI0023F01576|nr:hypothetical protein [Pyrobaculum aerophilum]MCX8137585.1 hypothetical protein [Pyrobaculum aerophilum]
MLAAYLPGAVDALWSLAVVAAALPPNATGASGLSALPLNLPFYIRRWQVYTLVA